MLLFQMAQMLVLKDSLLASPQFVFLIGAILVVAKAKKHFHQVWFFQEF